MCGGQPVEARIEDSSEASIGRVRMGKNMLACSVDSQSRRGIDLDAVVIMRKEGFGVVKPLVLTYKN